MTMDLPWPQISGAIAGGLFGGFSGFVASSLQERAERGRRQRNVACALIGEIEGLCRHIDNRLGTLRGDLQAMEAQRDYTYHHFRGERDYMLVYRSLGKNVGLLPNPLPRDLVSWYIGLAVCLERENELHQLALQRNPEWLDYALEVAVLQSAAFTELLKHAAPLVDRLSRL
jgi:hypothetical protein